MPTENALHVAFWNEHVLLAGRSPGHPTHTLALWDVTHTIEVLDDPHHPCHAHQLRDPPAVHHDQQLMPLKQALSAIPASWMRTVIRAHQRLRWDVLHQHCGCCGQRTTRVGHAMERRCPHCQVSRFPTLSPAIIVLIQRGDEALLARSAHFPPGSYGLVAGFVEPGETLEEAVHREVQEEVSLTVGNLRYMGSQPWPFPDALMVAFTAEHLDGEIVLADGELSEAGWYSRDALPGQPSSSISIAQTLINRWVDGTLHEPTSR